MDASPLNAVIIPLVFAAAGLYALYFVVRSGVRDGILQAELKRGTVPDKEDGSDGRH